MFVISCFNPMSEFKKRVRKERDKEFYSKTLNKKNLITEKKANTINTFQNLGIFTVDHFSLPSIFQLTR